MLMLYRHYGADDVEAAVVLALEKNIRTSPGVEHILLYTGEVGTVSAPLADWPRLPPPDVTVYGQLGGGR